MTKYYDIIVDGPKGGSVSGDVQERAKEILTKHWRKYAENRYNNQYEDVDLSHAYDKQFIIDAMVELAGASGELESLKAENERLRKALQKIAKHKHPDLSCSLEAQGYSQIKCVEIGVKHDLAMIASEALTKQQ